MKITGLKFSFLFIAVCFLISVACAAPTICEQTYTIGRMNQTPNMTGAPCDTTWNISYYLRDTTRSLTGLSVYRDVNDETLSLYGGNTVNPQGGHIQLYGGDNVAMDGGMAFRVGDAVGNGISVMWIEGRTDTPFLSLVNHQIKDVLDPTDPQDAVTVAYYNAHMAGGGGGIVGTEWNISYFLRDGTRTITEGGNISRDTGDHGIHIFGGNITPATGAKIDLYGAYCTTAIGAGGMRFWVPNAAKDEFQEWLRVVGNTDNPKADFMARNVSNLKDPEAAQDASTKNYVDNLITAIFGNTTFLKTVSATNPNWDAKGYNITNVNLTPTAGTNAATKNYVDIQKGNDTAYATTAYVDSGDATVKAYDASNTSRFSSISNSRFFLANETVFSTPIVRLPHIFNSTTVLVEVICVGGGAGGGGVTGLAANSAGAGGGGSGGYGEAWFPVNPSTTAWISVGYNGTGGAPTPLSGMMGKPSNFTYGSAFINCTGGTGGASGAYGTTFLGAAGGTSGGVVVIGAVTRQWSNLGMNQTGMNGYRVSGIAAIPGDGGSNTLGAGAVGPTTSLNGVDCKQGYGGGGSGALSVAAGNRAGGGGCNGAIILREYASGWMGTAVGGGK